MTAELKQLTEKKQELETLLETMEGKREEAEKTAESARSIIDECEGSVLVCELDCNLLELLTVDGRNLVLQTKKWNKPTPP